MYRVYPTLASQISSAFINFLKLCHIFCKHTQNDPFNQVKEKKQHLYLPIFFLKILDKCLPHKIYPSLLLLLSFAAYYMIYFPVWMANISLISTLRDVVFYRGHWEDFVDFKDSFVFSYYSRF